MPSTRVTRPASPCAGGRTYRLTDGLAPNGRTAATLAGDPGEWVTNGQSFAFPARTALVDVRGAPSNGVRAFARERSGNSAVGLAGSAGQALLPGTFRTSRFDTAGTAGLDVFGNLSGCNTRTGSLTITLAQFGADGAVLHLRASFMQRCERRPQSLRGTVAFHAGNDQIGPAPFSDLMGSPAPGGARLSWVDPGGDWARSAVRAVRQQRANRRHDRARHAPGAAGTAALTGRRTGEPLTFAVLPVDRLGNIGTPAAVPVTAG